jgi:hypothetical protein
LICFTIIHTASIAHLLVLLPYKYLLVDQSAHPIMIAILSTTLSPVDLSEVIFDIAIEIA